MNTIRSSRRTILFGVLYILLLPVLATPAASAADRVVSGKWEAAMTTDGATKTVSYCVSPAEATSINGDSKTGRDFAEKKAEKLRSTCKIKSYEIKGDTVLYSLACGDRTISDKTVFHGETSDGVKTLIYDGKTTTTHVKSRRIGTCP